MEQRADSLPAFLDSTTLHRPAFQLHSLSFSRRSSLRLNPETLAIGRTCPVSRSAKF